MKKKETKKKETKGFKGPKKEKPKPKLQNHKFPLIFKRDNPSVFFSFSLSETRPATIQKVLIWMMFIDSKSSLQFSYVFFIQYFIVVDIEIHFPCFSDLSFPPVVVSLDFFYLSRFEVRSILTFKKMSEALLRTQIKKEFP